MAKPAKIITTDQIELLVTDRLKPNPHNARTHSPQQIGKLAGLIKEFGFNGTILIDETDTVLAGHGRLAAAKLLKMDKVPVTRVSHLTKPQKRALVIADNKIGLESAWDMDKLAEEIAELTKEGVEVGLTAFSSEEIANILASVKTEGFGEGNGGTTPEVGSSKPQAEAMRYTVIISCASMFEQENILGECQSRGWNTKSGK